MSRRGESRGPEGKLLVVRHWGEAREGSRRQLLSGLGVLFQGDGNTLEIDVVAAQHWECAKRTNLFPLIWLILCFLNFTPTGKKEKKEIGEKKRDK